MHWNVVKFDYEAAKSIKLAVEDVRNFNFIDISAGKPFRRQFPYLGVQYVLEIRKT
jgi:hypothetical protein